MKRNARLWIKSKTKSNKEKPKGAKNGCMAKMKIKSLQSHYFPQLLSQLVNLLSVNWWEMHVGPTVDSGENSDNHSRIRVN